jgi:hypothetical protein
MKNDSPRLTRAISCPAFVHYTTRGKKAAPKNIRLGYGELDKSRGAGENEYVILDKGKRDVQE